MKSISWKFDLLIVDELGTLKMRDSICAYSTLFLTLYYAMLCTMLSTQWCAVIPMKLAFPFLLSPFIYILCILILSRLFISLLNFISIIHDSGVCEEIIHHLSFHVLDYFVLLD